MSFNSQSTQSFLIYELIHFGFRFVFCNTEFLPNLWQLREQLFPVLKGVVLGLGAVSAYPRACAEVNQDGLHAILPETRAACIPGLCPLPSGWAPFSLIPTVQASPPHSKPKVQVLCCVILSRGTYHTINAYLLEIHSIMNE